jgi:PHD/YefM family antitoxin component YafN of YafNO toxin-antitoxin module
MMKIISVTDLVRNAASIAREVEAEGTVYRITRDGRGSMVLVGEEYFNGWMAAVDEMRRPDWRAVYDETTRDIEAGQGRDLDVVVKELGLEG